MTLSKKQFKEISDTLDQINELVRLKNQRIEQLETIVKTQRESLDILKVMQNIK